MGMLSASLKGFFYTLIVTWQSEETTCTGNLQSLISNMIEVIEILLQNWDFQTLSCPFKKKSRWHEI